MNDRKRARQDVEIYSNPAWENNFLREVGLRAGVKLSDMWAIVEAHAFEEPDQHAEECPAQSAFDDVTEPNQCECSMRVVLWLRRILGKSK